MSFVVFDKEGRGVAHSVLLMFGFVYQGSVRLLTSPYDHILCTFLQRVIKTVLTLGAEGT